MMARLPRVAALASCALVLAACQSAAASHDGASSSIGGAPATSPGLADAPHPTVALASSRSAAVPWRGPVVIKATHSTIASVKVQDRSGHVVTGALSSHKQAWRSHGFLLPSTTYRATLGLVTPSGTTVTRQLRFSTTQARDSVSMSATPGPGWVMGVGEPIAVRFSRAVPDRAAVERHMTVSTSAGRVRGAWHWFSDTVAHFRPRRYWPANTSITVHVDLNHVYAGQGVWGDRDHDWTWRTGDAHIAYVNSARHTFRVTVNGRTTHVWPTGTGMPGFDTRRGTYLVLDKSHEVEMTSCSVGLSCTPGTSTYYDLHVFWDTRLTDSGTFVHAAPWDSQIGAANTSHGCIHLSVTNAQTFYGNAMPGDVVKLTGSTRPPNPVDAGMMDWNMSWHQWVAGSALHH
ncbi:MAG: Ig-like domain-containing protein [Nocardioidaceae bacterium]